MEEKRREGRGEACWILTSSEAPREGKEGDRKGGRGLGALAGLPVGLSFGHWRPRSTSQLSTDHEFRAT